MTKKEPTTLLRRHTTVANSSSHYEGYNRNQVVSKFTDTRTNSTTGIPGTHHLHPKCCMICHPAKHPEAKQDNECPPED